MQLHDTCLQEGMPRSANGQIVASLGDLKVAQTLTKEGLRQQSNNSSHKKGFGRHTSGSTGEPTSVRLTKAELGRLLGVRDYCFRHYGIKLGEREARLWGRVDDSLKARIGDLLLNRETYNPGAADGVRQVKRLTETRAAYIYGYVSLLLEAARLMEANGWRPPKVSCIICTAEKILESQKRYLARIFNAPVVEEYGATEFDIIAFECKDWHLHLVNPWLIVEWVNGQCVITDVSRRSQYFIRYVIGDTLRLTRCACDGLGGRFVVEELEGRSANRFVHLSESKKFHASEFSQMINQYQNEYGDVFRFQIEQNDYTSFSMTVSPCPRKGQHHISDYLRENVKKKHNANIDIKVTVTADSGLLINKSGYFIQNIDQQHD